MKNPSHVSRFVERAQPGPVIAPRGPNEGDTRTARPVSGSDDPGVCSHPPVHGSGLDHLAGDAVALPSADLVQELARLFSLLSNETRLAIVLALRASAVANTELCVCDLATMVGASPSMTSHQLRLLRDGDVVYQRRDGKRALYRLVDGPLLHLLDDGMDHAKLHATLRPRKWGDRLSR
jgi:DNA-binding transcriptional ArsR family regulator